MELSPISNLFVAKTVSGPYLSPKGDFKHENMIECPARLNSLTGGKNRCKPVKTVSGPYLSSPDELESTCVRFRKRRSRLTTSQHITDACRMHLHSIWRFCAPRCTTPAPTHTAAHQNRTCTPDSRQQIRVRWRLEKLYPCVHRRFKSQYRADRIRDGKISRFPLFHQVPRCPDRFPMVFGQFFIVFA